jgi:cation diffusion facilitator CzcD-associated flavoprotein CzcO
MDGSGRWRAPAALTAGLPDDRYAHSAEAIDFSAVAGKRVGVLGVSASAFDNAAAALEAGAATVDLCCRRAEIPRVNSLVWANFCGMLGHFAELSDLERWRFMRCILEDLPMSAPQDSFWRCRRFENFAWHTDCAWFAAREGDGGAVVETSRGRFTFDFIIFATGFETDLAARPELAGFAHAIALWRDRFTPPEGEDSALLASHPYLGPAFEFIERVPGTAPFLSRLHNYTFGATPSLGITGAAITGLRYGVPRLVHGLVGALFREDAADHYRDLQTYSVPDLKTLESPSAWIDRLAADALDACGPIDEIDQVLLTEVFAGGPALQCSDDVGISPPVTGSVRPTAIGC